MELSFHDLPPADAVILRVENRTTAVIHHRGVKFVRIGYAHFVGDVAFCLGITREAAADLLDDPAAGPAVLRQVIDSRSAEFAEHVAGALAEAGIAPARARIESSFPRVPGMADVLERVIWIPFE